jgi:cell wall-associated NlpC family hydrolase
MMKSLSVAAILLVLIVFSAQAQVGVPVPGYDKQQNLTMGVDRNELIAFATHYKGIPYRHAGSDPKRGFDCSGFVNYVFNHFNISLPRCSREFKTLGKALKPEDFKVGDILVFYGFRDRGHIGHVGIICEANGMKSRFIHASSGKVHRVTISELDSPGYSSRFYECLSVIR